MGTLISTILDFFFEDWTPIKRENRKPNIVTVFFKKENKQINKAGLLLVLYQEISHHFPWNWTFQLFQPGAASLRGVWQRGRSQHRKQMSQINGRPSLCSKTFPKVKVKSIPVLWIPNWSETMARLSLRQRADWPWGSGLPWRPFSQRGCPLPALKKPHLISSGPSCPRQQPRGLRQNLPYLKKKMLQGFPGGSSGKESACQCRGRGFDPWSQKISHASGATKPVRHNYWACALEPTSHSCYRHSL